MPKKLEEIHSGVVRNLKGKTNPRTKKPYTDDEIWAIAQAQYKETKKEFNVMTKFNRIWEEAIEIEKSGIIEKSNQRFVEVVVSGLKEDRQGDMMSQECIDDMIMQFKSGSIGFFPDHGFHESSGKEHVYSWKQMMGVFVDGRQEEDKLMAVIRLNKAHPDQEMFWGFAKEGMPFGMSIGGRTMSEPVYVDVEETKSFEEAK